MFRSNNYLKRKIVTDWLCSGKNLDLIKMRTQIKSQKYLKVNYEYLLFSPHLIAALSQQSSVYDRMVGAILVKSFSDSLSCPVLCLDSLSSSGLNFKGCLELGLYKNSGGRKHLKKVNLSTSFLDAWYDWKLSAKMLSFSTAKGYSSKKHRFRSLTVVGELGGQYEDTFNDVKMEIINYFTFKAVRTVLEQLYEMNPPQYTYLHNFIADNTTKSGKRFLQTLAKERVELAERVMITRLSLYSRWIKKCDHAEIYKEISDENLKLMREKLMETIIWPSDDTNTEKTD